MTIELYAAPKMADQSEPAESPISNTMGTLPDQEPTLDLADLLGSFSSQEETLEFIRTQLAAQKQIITDSRSAPFSEYTHIEWLTLTIKTEDQQTESRSYYLVVADEGY